MAIKPMKTTGTNKKFPVKPVKDEKLIRIPKGPSKNTPRTLNKEDAKLASAVQRIGALNRKKK